ncbi:MAG: phosphorylcholine transferase LicD [Marinilabiliaceae bacterium]
MNLNEEVRNGYLITAETKKVWAVQIDLLKHLLDVCQRHKLKIWADGGTLLGTVREHGYIPWDDDIDMFMLREDYEKLRELAPTEFKSPYFFQTGYTDKMYPRGHAQLRYQGTTAILPGDLGCKFDQSIFIDIFVYDTLPKDISVFTDRMVKAEVLRKVMNWGAFGKLSLRTPKETCMRLAARAILRLLGFKRVYSKFEKLYADIPGEKSDVTSCPAFSASQVFRIHRRLDWLKETILMPFEDLEIPVPNGYDEILTDQYGDYMTPVKAPTMHGSVIFDADRPYKEILKEIKAGKISTEKN